MSNFGCWHGGLLTGHMLQFEQVEVRARGVFLFLLRVERRFRLLDVPWHVLDLSLPQTFQHVISESGRQIFHVTTRQDTTRTLLVAKMSSNSEHFRSRSYVLTHCRFAQYLIVRRELPRLNLTDDSRSISTRATSKSSRS